MLLHEQVYCSSLVWPGLRVALFVVVRTRTFAGFIAFGITSLQVTSRSRSQSASSYLGRSLQWGTHLAMS